MASAPRGLLALVTVVVGLYAPATIFAQAQGPPATVVTEAAALTTVVGDPVSPSDSSIVSPEDYAPPETVLHPSSDRAQPAAAPTTEPLLQYSGWPNRYYYASNPNQLYYKPAFEAPALAMGYGVPTMPSNLAPLRLVNPRATRRISIRITNPREYGVRISYSINGREDLIQPGGTRYWDLTDQAILVFSRGEKYAEASYSLESGSYRFCYNNAVNPLGWDIDPHPQMPSAPLAPNSFRTSENADPLSLVPAGVGPVGSTKPAPVGPKRSVPAATTTGPGSSELARNR